MSGPITMYFYKIKDRNILLLGDRHEYMTPCKGKPYIPIHRFLKALFTETSVESDMFLEVASPDSAENHYGREVYENWKKKIQSSHIKTTNYLRDTANIFLKYGCFQKSKDLCKKQFPNTRFHYLDYRASDNAITYKLSKFEFYELPTIAMISKAVLDSIDSNPKIQKQINNMEKNDASKLKSYIKDYVANVKNSYPDYDKINILFQKVSSPSDIDKKILDNIQRFFKKIVSGMCLIEMDAYTIGRLFRRYRDDSCSKNIIMYAGASHIENYRNFFENYLGATSTCKILTDKEVLNINSQCVNIPKRVLRNFIDLEGLNRILSLFKTVSKST